MSDCGGVPCASTYTLDRTSFLMKPNFGSEMQFGSNLPVCNTSQLQEHEKEKIKNIMLQQEATFKHQVSELHRVYRKQRELIDEIKMISPNSIIASCLKDTKLLPSSSNVLTKRTIGLELPADEYIDHEEGRFVDGTVEICTTQGLNWLTDKIGILDHRSAHALTVSKMNWSAQSEIFKNRVYPKYQIDLNSSPNEDGTEQMEVEMKNAADINLEPPVSQVNKESSPPRGNSMEKQPAESVELTAQDEKCQKYLVQCAAEALVLVSSNSARSFERFAENVQLENRSVQDRLADSGYSSDSTGNKITAGLATSSGLPKRKLTKRTKSQKEIRGDILPHITSPSRQEVSQEISGLRENEGKAKFGKKKSSKNERKREEKHKVKSNVMQHPSCSFQKQQDYDTDLLNSLGCLPGWGAKNNRQAGQRRPAHNRA